MLLVEPPPWQLHKGLLSGIEPWIFWSKDRRAILLPRYQICVYLKLDKIWVNRLQTWTYELDPKKLSSQSLLWPQDWLSVNDCDPCGALLLKRWHNYEIDLRKSCPFPTRNVTSNETIDLLGLLRHIQVFILLDTESKLFQGCIN